jgi:hypothetical protein
MRGRAGAEKEKEEEEEEEAEEEVGRRDAKRAEGWTS